MIVSTTSSQTYCQACPTSCLDCVYSAGIGMNCTLCQGSLYLINGTCLTTCPSGTYPSLSTSSCINCGLPGCQTCVFNSSFLVECTKCMSGYLMLSDSLICVTVCPSGYTQSGPKCIPKPPCYGYLLNGFCYSTCPVGTYPIQANSTTNTAQSCANCSLDCRICISSTSCEQCNNNSVLHSTASTSACLSYCPVGYYNSSGICMQCPANCQACFWSVQNGLVTCSLCTATYY